MKNEPLLQIASHLCHIPGGTFMVKQHPTNTKRSSLFMDSFQTRTSGKGRMDIYQVFPGIHLSLNLFLADQVSFRHNADQHILEITHCHLGRIGWNFHSGTSVYLGSGDLSLQSTDCCADSVMVVSSWILRGNQYFYSFKRSLGPSSPVLEDAGLDINRIDRLFCRGDTSTAFPASPDIDGIFRPLYGLPKHLRLPYFRLKVQELLLFLSRLSPEDSGLAQYQSRQTA